MKNAANLQNLINCMGTILFFTVLIAFIMAGYLVATGNFHQYVNL